jgi:conserved protein with predicted RNA binding PUA domain
LSENSDRRRISVTVDYLFGKGVSSAVPESGLRLVYSRRSGRLKLVLHEGEVFATVKPGGAMALSLHGAELLSRSPKFRENCVTVVDEAAEFVRGGRSVFCKFVKSAGTNVLPRGEVAVLSSKGAVLGVGTAVMAGRFMKQFKSGAAVKVRTGRRA